MTLEADEKRFLTLRNTLWGLGSLVAVGLIAGVFLLLRSEKAINRVDREVEQVEDSLNGDVDTPVILIGGSVTFKQKSKGTKLNWDPLTDGRNGYTTNGKGPIATIVIKANYEGTDSEINDGSTDRLRVSVPDGKTWSVDLFTKKPSPNKAKVTISSSDTSKLSTIDMVLLDSKLGILCPDATTSVKSVANVYYNDSGSCPNPPVADENTFFTSITVTVDNKVVGTLNCFSVDSTGTTVDNKCRVVFRTKPLPLTNP
jgi:hypothetical protein